MSQAKDIIALQMTWSSETLLLAMEPIDAEEFFKENADGYSAAWVMGHLACVADLFASWLERKGLLFDAEFHSVFNETQLVEPGALNRAEVTAAQFSKELLLYRFNQAILNALRVLDEFDESQWSAPPPPEAAITMVTNGMIWTILARHVDWHCGQLAGSMPRFFGTYALNTWPHHCYRRRSA